MSRRSPLLARLGAAVLAVGLVAGCTQSATTADGPLPGASDSGTVAEPTLTAVGGTGTTVPWKQPLALTVNDGTLTRIDALGPDGLPIEGTLTTSTWTSTLAYLVPGRTYSVTATVEDARGRSRDISASWVASPADKVLRATITPAKGAVVGVAQPVVVRFDQPVKGAANRTAVMQRLSVTTTPAVEGAWRWYNSYEVHYRAEKYWKSGTTIDVSANLGLLRLAGTGTWGSTKVQTTRFTIGKDYRSVVDLKAFTMVVTLDGKVIRRMKISGGSAKYPTKGGVHIVLNREKVHLFNSATVGIPTDSPDGYYKELPWSVRISNGGAFVHSQPGSIRSQGRRNVSHGCVNANPVDAEWFYYHSQLGDPVDIINAVVPPTKWDAGMFDWNWTWAQWKTGNLEG